MKWNIRFSGSIYNVCWFLRRLFLRGFGDLQMICSVCFWQMSERAISFMCTKSSPLPSLYPHHQHHRIMIHVDEYTGIKITNTNTFTPHHHVCISIAIASENHCHQLQKNYHHDFSWNVSFEGDALFTKELWSTRCWFDRRENWNKSENWSEVMVISFKLAMKPSN